MSTYTHWAPTVMDRSGAFMEPNDPRLNWIVAISNTPKIATILDQLNYDIFLEEMEKCRTRTETFEEQYIGHWATDIEIILVNPNSKAGRKAKELIQSLEDYPLLDEDRYSEKRWEAICDFWEEMDMSERMEYCKEAGLSIFSARSETPPTDVYDWLSCSIY